MSETTLSRPRDPFRVKPYVPPAVKLAEPPVNKQERIEWRPLAGPSNVPFSGTDYVSVRKALVGMWGTFPIRLSKANGDAEAMKAMMFAAGEGQEPYHILHQALMQYGEIELQDV